MTESHCSHRMLIVYRCGLVFFHTYSIQEIHLITDIDFHHSLGHSFRIRIIGLQIAGLSIQHHRGCHRATPIVKDRQITNRLVHRTFRISCGTKYSKRCLIGDCCPFNNRTAVTTGHTDFQRNLPVALLCSRFIAAGRPQEKATCQSQY